MLHTGEVIKIYVKVINNNVEKALGVLKKALQKDGILEELRRRQHFEKPSVRKRRKRVEAQRRLVKKLAKR